MLRSSTVKHGLKSLKFAATAILTVVASTLQGTDIRTANIGYPPCKGPTPISHGCLDPQVVYGANTTIHVGSAVEPSIAVNPRCPKHIIAVWQQDRITTGGGSLEIGIAHSHDCGKSWTRTTVPFQIYQGGISQRVSDPWISWSNDGKHAYLCALPFNATLVPNTQNQSGIVVSISKNNGHSWSEPQWIASSQDQ